MKSFTYKDYIKCIHTLRLNAVFKLAEESSKYNLNSTDTEDKKIIKNILKDKKQMAKFINEFLDLNEIIDNKNLIEYNNEYLSSKYKLDKNKCMYKLKNKEIFFLLEEVFKFDNIVLYEILNYCISIMQEWNITNKVRGEHKYPIIVPIIIYAGTTKLNIKYKSKNNQIGDYIFKNYNINLNYNLIDVNKISMEVLLCKHSTLSYGMILEKSKNIEELEKNLNSIIENINDNIQLKNIENVLKYIPVQLSINKDKIVENIKMKKIEIIKNIEKKREFNNKILHIKQK